VTRAAICVLLCAQILPLLASSAVAAPLAEAARIAPAGPRTPRAPERAPLLSTGNPTGGASGAEEDQGAGVEGEADPLVSNGLASPTCKGALDNELSGKSRSHCETSGFVGAPAPTGDYGIDVHIDTGLLGLSAGGLQSTVQDLLISPLWNALVWLVHALVVMLEWCFTVDLLDSPAAGGLARGLRRTQASFTEPWLALVLALAAMFAVYQGLIRRRVADTLGEMLLMAAMMVAGLWTIADPTGSVGALGEWANQASLGTMAVTASGTPRAPGRTLANSLEAIFATAIEGPWCYMEFGSVDWCREPARLQRSLRSAGLSIASQELTRAGCSSISACAAAGSSAQALQHSAALLRQAQSNGAIFLALPADGPERNSINDTGSLLRAICQSSEATSCHGPAAAQAEFRTGAHTWERASGLLLIAAGLLGMLLLLGFLALRLLMAAIFSLLYLLLAPAVVLAPAFGESGRAIFRRWAAQLLGAVVSKLLFSFLLGVVLAVLSILSDLTAIGWWTQWLLMSAFWWGTFMRRHQALSVIGGSVGREQASRHSVMGTARQALVKRGVYDVYDRVRRKLDGPPSPGVSSTEKVKTERFKRAPRKPQVEEQSSRSLANEYRQAGSRSKHNGRVGQRIAQMRTRLQRLGVERANALATGDRKRASSLERRSAVLTGEIEHQQTALDAAQRITGVAESVFVREHRAERERFLDGQAMLPPRARPSPGGQRRDYSRLAGLAGYGREQYEELAPRKQREARLEIDRELALRNELGQRLGSSTAGGEASAERTPPRSPRERAQPVDDPASEQIDPELIRAARESPIMRDAREVEAGRKRQLGKGRP